MLKGQGLRRGRGSRRLRDDGQAIVAVFDNRLACQQGPGFRVAVRPQHASVGRKIKEIHSATERAVAQAGQHVRQRGVWREGERHYYRGNC